jgi:hypothetical protein
MALFKGINLSEYLQLQICSSHSLFFLKIRKKIHACLLTYVL